MTIPEQPREFPTGWIPDEGFGERLNKVRRTLDLTLREAADLCELNYRTWQTWEDGRRPQDVLSVVEKISAKLGVDRNWLAWGEIDPDHAPLRLSRNPIDAGDAPFSGSDIDAFLDVADVAPLTAVAVPHARAG